MLHWQLKRENDGKEKHEMLDISKVHEIDFWTFLKKNALEVYSSRNEITSIFRNLYTTCYCSLQKTMSTGTNKLGINFCC